MSFDEILLQSVQHTLIDFIRKGDWLTVDYGNRVKLDASLLRQMQGRVDMTVVMDLVKQQVEQRIADSIMNSMQQEIANDVKSIMSNRELREDIRSVIREKIRACEKSLTVE